jgi:hypothetical protein
MRVVAVAIGIVAAFWAGYGLCSYRAYGLVFPELSRSQATSDASFLIRYVDLIDRGDVVSLRAKLLAVAKVNITPSPPTSRFAWKSFFPGPLEDVGGLVASTRHDTDTRIAAIQAELARICENPPATDTYRSICGR